ncbi:MAG: hypothetical protein CL793_07320 [Chloroflexi bacterium]|nr:hypothetical protein [Chloroflexota bacterium]|tara:strand:- start:746 stop:970 length:225 start_codon:yes stop_codon:yes gene_type:complete
MNPSPYPDSWKKICGFNEEKLLFYLSLSDDPKWFLHVFVESWKINGSFNFAIEMAVDVMKEYPKDPRKGNLNDD